MIYTNNFYPVPVKIENPLRIGRAYPWTDLRYNESDVSATNLTNNEFMYDVSNDFYGRVGGTDQKESRRHLQIESIKTTSMEDVSTRVLEKKKNI